MRAADAVVLAGDLLDLIEAEAQAAPDDATRAQLAAEHDEVWAILERAQQAATGDRARAMAAERAERAADWESVRFLSRRALTPAMKSAIIRRHGLRRYRSLPW